MARKTSKNSTAVETPEVETTETEAKVAKVSKKDELQASRVLDAETAAWIAQNARPAVSLCLCGCGSETKGRFFPGHDALLKERLKASIAIGSGQAKTDAEAALVSFGW